MIFPLLRSALLFFCCFNSTFIRCVIKALFFPGSKLDVCVLLVSLQAALCFLVAWENVFWFLVVVKHLFFMFLQPWLSLSWSACFQHQRTTWCQCFSLYFCFYFHYICTEILQKTNKKTNQAAFFFLCTCRSHDCARLFVPVDRSVALLSYYCFKCLYVLQINLTLLAFFF